MMSALRIESAHSSGTVYLVGAGPGAPDLLTVRAARLLAQADVVFYDALVHPETLALASAARHVPVGKRCSRLSTDQRFINRCLVEAAKKYRCIIRLKGGDPLLFGRAEEELAALRAAAIPVEIVPGITAALAASAQLGVSLTRRGVARQVTFATARVGEGEAATQWATAVGQSDTAVLYMGVKQAAAISATLLAQGRAADTPVVVVANASLPDSQHWVTTLAALPQLSAVQHLEVPAILLLGEVYRAQLQPSNVAQAA